MMEKTIRITKETHTALTKLGNKGDSFNDIIIKLILEHNEHEQDKE